MHDSCCCADSVKFRGKNCAMEAALREARAGVSRWWKGTFVLPEKAPETGAFSCLIDGLVVHIHAGFFQQSRTGERPWRKALWNSTPLRRVLVKVDSGAE